MIIQNIFRQHLDFKRIISLDNIKTFKQLQVANYYYYNYNQKQ